MSKVTYSIVCEESGYSRTVEVPFDARGWASILAEDFDRAIELFELRRNADTARRAAKKVRDHLAASPCCGGDFCSGHDDYDKLIADLDVKELLTPNKETDND